MNTQDFIVLKRKELGITQKELACLLGMNENGERTVRSWESGEYKPSKTRLEKLIQLKANHPFKFNSNIKHQFTFIDLFAGIGGLRLPFQNRKGKCVFSSEIDINAQKTYFANYGEYPHGDITKIKANDIPDHDLLLAGFPCQAFSQAGLRKGFYDPRGTMFFEIQRILAKKKPKMFLLENVKTLRSHNKSQTFKVIKDILTGNFNENNFENISIENTKLNYWISYIVLNAFDFGVPQNRERIFIVGFNKDYFNKIPDFSSFFSFPSPLSQEYKEKIKVGNILENVSIEDTTYTITDRMWIGHQKRKESHKQKGNGFGYSLFTKNSPCTNTISARYYKDGSEALIDQSEYNKNPRMLTPRECARLQGFPDEFCIDYVSKVNAYKQFGNSVCIKVVDAVAEKLIETYLKANKFQLEN